jgi:hypothetical protein
LNCARAFSRIGQSLGLNVPAEFAWLASTKLEVFIGQESALNESIRPHITPEALGAAHCGLPGRQPVPRRYLGINRSELWIQQSATKAGHEYPTVGSEVVATLAGMENPGRD